MNQQLPQFIHHVVDRLQAIEGIVAFSAKRNCEATALRGSRARGDHTLKSDVDLGLYYQPENPPDLLSLNHLASELDNSHRTNLITRRVGLSGLMVGVAQGGRHSSRFPPSCVAQVNQVIDDCHAGKIMINYQPGHPHGFLPSIYMGEVALYLPLHHLYDVLPTLKAKITPYPAKLKQPLINSHGKSVSRWWLLRRQLHGVMLPMLQAAVFAVWHV